LYIADNEYVDFFIHQKRRSQVSLLIASPMKNRKKNCMIWLIVMVT